MAEKKLKISLDLDDKAFQSAVKRMQEQLNQLNNPANLLQQQRQIDQKMRAMGLGGLPGAPSSGQVQQEQNKAKQQSDKIFEETRRKMEVIKKLQGDLNKEQASGLASEQRKFQIQERLNELKKQELRTTGELHTLVNRGNLTGGPAPGNQGSSTAALSSLTSSITGTAAVVTGAAAAITGVALMIENIRRSFAESGGRATELLSASIAQAGAPGAQFNALYAGKSMEEFMFRGERAKAHGVAGERMEGRLNNPLAAILRPRQSLMGVFGNQGQKDMVQAELRQEFEEEQAKQYEALKSSPEGLKKLRAQEQFRGAAGGYLSTQRQLGLDYSTFHGPGGFRERAVGAGFTDDMAAQMSGQIIGAGGSTRMGRGSVTGLQAARNMDITNAGGILGNLSQTLGSSQASTQAFVKMIAEGNRLGLDGSEFREENRKFLDATAQVISRSETGNQADIENIVKRFGGFMAEPTTRGIQGAQGAYQAFNQITSANTGPQGVMRAAGMLQDSVIGGMSPMDRASLSTIPADQLSADHPIVQELSRKYGKSPEDLVGRLQKAGAGAIHRLPQGDVLTKSLAAKRAQMMGPLSAKGMGEVGGQINQQEQELFKVTAIEYPEMAKNRKQMEAFIKGTTQPAGAGRTDMFEEMAKKKLEGPGETGRAEDEMVKALAADSKAILESFRGLKDVIVPAADGLDKFNKAVKENLDIVGRTPVKKEEGSFFHPTSRSRQPQGGR